MKNNNFSSELQNILAYMTDILSKEFPTNIYTIEYLIVSILDNKNCHAHQILDNCLMTRNIEELKKIYVNWLENNKKINIIPNKNGLFNFNSDLDLVLKNAENEKNIINSPIIGSEHVLLSLLNPINNCNKVQEVFKTIGLDYNFLLKKCTENKNNPNDNKNKLKLMQKPNMIMPLKSEVNKKGISSKTDYIDQFTISLNKMAEKGEIDELIGRKTEVEKIIKILSRRKKNNVVLVGKGGCGCSHIVYGIANLIYRNEVPDIIKGKDIVMMDVMALVSGTHFRGMFEERVKGLFAELKESKNHILFIDDMQQVLRSNSKEKDTDLSSWIGNILAEGEVRVIGTCNFKDYRNSVENNVSIARKLQKIVIEPTSIEETIEILNNNKHYYEKYHNVEYSDEVIEKCVRLADRYITDRSLPDSAFDVVDLSGAYTCLINRAPKEVLDAKVSLKSIDKKRSEFLNKGEFELVDSLNAEENHYKKIISDFNREYEKNTEKYKIQITTDDIALAVSEITSIPINKLSLNEKEKIANIDNVLKEHVVGQDEAIDKICRAVKRQRIGLGNKNKPVTILALGPTGSGKSLIAKTLAKEIYGSENDLVRIDMSEYSEKSSVSKLTGSNPGYVGFENGGQLTEAIKHKQYCVLLLDEIEKADKEVYNIFLQLFDEGRLTDNSGQLINFKNVIIIMTSNVGAREASELGKGVGFSTDEGSNKRSIIEKSLKNRFAPEFINRIDNIVYFNSLTDNNLKDIVRLEMEKFRKRMNELKYDFTYTDSVVDFLHGLCVKDKEYGARPIIRLIQNNIEDKVTDLLLMNEYCENYCFKMDYINNELTIK